VDTIVNERDLICEALVREIRDASRWSAVVEAWDALLKVRRMANSRIEELRGPLNCGAVDNSTQMAGE